MDIGVRLRETVYIDEDTHDIYKKLTLDNELKLFPTMKDLFLVSAALGFFYGNKKPLTKRKDIFKKHIFNELIDIPFLFAIVFSETKDKSVFGDETVDIVSIVEEYANAGIREIANIVSEARDKNSALRSFVEFLLEKFG